VLTLTSSGTLGVLDTAPVSNIDNTREVNSLAITETLRNIL
jgi:hypothetical protein